MMRRQLSALAIISSIFMLGCKGGPDKAVDSSGTAGGGAAHIDSLKTIGTGVNGESANTLDAKDTMANGHSAASPADTSKKKPPGSIK